MSNRWGTGRIESFSDGVFAIALTLLVFDLAVPASSFNDLWRGIAHEWPSYLAYVTSFVTIGGLWMAHLAIFRRLQSANPTIMRLNLLVLMGVAFLPFPTGLMAKAIRDTNAERAAVVFYGVTLLLISILLRALWDAIVHHPELLDQSVSTQEIKPIRRSSLPNIGFYAAAIALALAVPQAAVFGYLAIAVAAVWRARGDRSPQPAGVEAA